MNKELKLDIEEIMQNYPNTWKDIMTFFQTRYKSFLEKQHIAFSELPFDWQLGILIIYFHDNGTEIEINNTDPISLLESINIAFLKNEKSMSHYS